MNLLDKTSFNNSNINLILLTIDYLSIEMICILKNSLKTFYINQKVNYYNAIHIENRNDVNCFKTLVLIKWKILYPTLCPKTSKSIVI